MISIYQGIIDGQETVEVRGIEVKKDSLKINFDTNGKLATKSCVLVLTINREGISYLQKALDIFPK